MGLIFISCITFDIDRNGYHNFDPSYITQYVHVCISLRLVAETSKFKQNYEIVCQTTLDFIQTTAFL